MAQDPPFPTLRTSKPDKAYASSFEIAGKQIPLPAGEWRVVTQIDRPAAVDHPSAGYVRQAVMVQLKKQVPAAVIVATFNTEPSATGWGTSRDCTRNDILSTALLYESGIDVSCNFINHVVRVGADAASPLDSDIARQAKGEGWSMPPTWLMAGFRIADRRDLFDVRYHFNPKLVLPGRPAASWDGSPWSRAAVALSRNRAAVVASLSGWVGAAQEAIDAWRSRSRHHPVRKPGWRLPREPTGRRASKRQSAGGLSEQYRISRSRMPLPVVLRSPAPSPSRARSQQRPLFWPRDGLGHA